MLRYKIKHGVKLGRSLRPVVAIAIFFCAFAGTARAQWHAGRLPQIEMSGNYSFIRARAANAGQTFDLNGGGTTFAYAHNDHFSSVVDVGAYHFVGFQQGLNSTMYTYMFGPRITFSGARRAVPFAQILLGAGRLNASSTGVKAGENGFVMAVGGGLDVPLHRHFAVRVVQAEYLLTRFNSVNGSPAEQSSIRISAGVVLRFGRQ
jgi:outer membrane protein with beta-barrel domain